MCYVFSNLYLNLQEEKLLPHDVCTRNDRAEDRVEVAAANDGKTHAQASQQYAWLYSGSICGGKDLPQKLLPWIQIWIIRSHIKEGQVYNPPQHGSNGYLRYQQPRDHMVARSSKPTGHLRRHNPPSAHRCFWRKKDAQRAELITQYETFEIYEEAYKEKIVLACKEA